MRVTASLRYVVLSTPFFYCFLLPCVSVYPLAIAAADSNKQINVRIIVRLDPARGRLPPQAGLGNLSNPSSRVGGHIHELGITFVLGVGNRILRISI